MSTNSARPEANGLFPYQTTARRTPELAEQTTTVKSSSFDAIRCSPRHNFGTSVHTTSAADRRAFEIPTPPHSDTTSSASGSRGSGRKDSSDALSGRNHAAILERLQPPIADRAASASSRSPSVTSSSTHTGSDTIGATSPRQPDQSTFRSSRHAPQSTMTSDAGAASPRADRLLLSQSDTDADNFGASPSALRTSLVMSPHTDSPGERRKRRSEMHERDVSQIRSESRIGISNADDDDDDLLASHGRDQHTFLRSAQHRYSPRKSTTLSVISHSHEGGELTGRDQSSLHERHSDRRVDSPSTPTSAKASRLIGVDDLSSGSSKRLVRTMGQSSNRASLDDHASPRPASSAGRSPMPSEFRLPRKEIRRAYRAAHQQTASDSDTSDAETQRIPQPVATVTNTDVELRSLPSARRESLDGSKEEQARGTATQSPVSHQRTTSIQGTDARLDYEGRLGSQGSRISVDSSSAQRFLARNSHDSTPSSSARRAIQSSGIGSPSEDARARKISNTSSTRSQKSSSSASELHRAASRVSMAKHHGSDLFSTDTVSSSSAASASPYSPSIRTETSYSSTNSSDRSRPYLDQPHRSDDAGLGSLRDQIQDLRVGRAEAENDRRRAPPISLRPQAQLGSKRSSVDLNSPRLGSVRAQSVMGLQRSPNDSNRALQMPQHPFTDPQQYRYDRSLPAADPDSSSDAVRRIHDLVRLRDGPSAQPSGSVRSATALGTAADSFTTGSLLGQLRGNANRADEPAPIRNLAVRLAQYEALYSKTPSADASSTAATGSDTARTVELMSAIVRGTSTMWAELTSMHPIATEGHLMGRQGDAFTEAFGQLDEGLAFVNKLVLEQARAMQDLLYLLDRTEKERQTQFNQALVEMGRSPRPFSRIGTPSAAALASNGTEAGTSAERNAQMLRRATSSVRSGSSLQKESPSPFARPLRSAGGSANKSETLTASQLRSMTSLGYTNNHARSASEFSPSSAAAQRRNDRVAAEKPPGAPLDSPLSSRRRASPTDEAAGAESSFSAGSDATGGLTSRPPPALTPRRPRLSNPSVSNATASFQRTNASAAPSVFASSPESSIHNEVTGGEQMDSEGSTVGGHCRARSEVDESSRVAGAYGAPLSGGETVRLSSRRQRAQDATIRVPRVIDTLTSQLDTLSITDEAPDGQRLDEPHVSTAYRRYTLSDVSSPSDSPSKPKSNPPPRPPRHIQRPSEDYISSPERRPNARSGETSTPTTPQIEAATPRQGSRAGATEDVSAASAMVRSLGRTAARRVSRVLGSGQ